MYKWQNKDEYHGQFKSNKINGEGIFKEGVSGKIYSAIWEEGKKLKVLDVIKQ